MTLCGKCVLVIRSDSNKRSLLAAILLLHLVIENAQIFSNSAGSSIRTFNATNIINSHLSMEASNHESLANAICHRIRNLSYLLPTLSHTVYAIVIKS